MSATASTENEVLSRVRALAYWQGPVILTPLIGGLCNRNFIAEHQSEKLVVRVGDDIPVHGISQACVEVAMRNAAKIGVSPALRYASAGLSISDFVVGRHLVPRDLEDDGVLAGLVMRLRELHASKPVSGTLAYFWPFQVVHGYLRYCHDHGSNLVKDTNTLSEHVDSLERLVTPFLPVFTHNDVVPQNAMLDGNGRVYLIDWDYGAFGHPLFDLAGITANADVDASVDAKILSLYGSSTSPEFWKQFRVFKLMVNLRELLWGAVQELESKLDTSRVEAGMASIYPEEARGYAGYFDLNLRRFHRNFAEFRNLYG